jgi:hypothetical protein
MERINVAGMLNVPVSVCSHIMATLGSKEDVAWEYDPIDHILIVDMHKLLAPINYDDEEQMSDILAHIHFGGVDHLIIHAYVESCTQDRFNGCFMTLYHPIDVRCFSKRDDLVRNLPPELRVTCKMHGDLEDYNE